METVQVLGATVEGATAELVTVEGRFEPADRGGFQVQLTGLPDPVLRESRGRLASALGTAGLRVPQGRLHLNLAPATRPKAGGLLDLPLVLAAAGALGHLEPGCLAGTLFLGEVGLDGTLRGAPGGLAAALAAERRGLRRVVAARACAREAAAIEALWVAGADRLVEVLGHLARGSGGSGSGGSGGAGDDVPDGDVPESRAGVLARAGRLPREPAPPDPDPAAASAGLDEVRGQPAAKWGLTVAAAGGHALLLCGPPGCGKTMLARRLTHLLPPPSRRERLEITGVWSAADRWPGGLVRERPFRAPHHTTSHAGLIGGGPLATPGEVTLAHRGVLFLDELPEFRRETLEGLRQPLESGDVLVSRARRRTRQPARFLLVAAMNPCPCGYRGHPRRPCTCPPTAVHRYRQRISGPLLDRFELRLELGPPTLDELLGGGGPASGGPSEAELREGLARAAATRGARGQRPPNARLSAGELDRVAALDPAGLRLLGRAVEEHALSARAVQGLRRVARTLADLEGASGVGAAHLAQALGLRAPLG